MTTEAWNSLVDAASSPYRRAGSFAWHFARGKLRLDPVFQHIISQGLIAPDARVLDIGCGQGLLASLLQAADAEARNGRWPAAWATAPSRARVTGIDLMPKDIERARAALGDSARFVCGDMRHTDFPANDTTVILDVLHYISVAEQDAVLARVRAALSPGGALLLRVGDAQARRGFVLSQWVDRAVTLVRGHRVMPLFCRPLMQWIATLQSLGFEVQSRPMSQGTPFANVLLVARVAAVVPAAVLPDASVRRLQSVTAEVST
jgi:2-polyprenyl-3-methyl-5-hydroxy-6-metoxy-1,4-benzoquinol methylase